MNLKKHWKTKAASSKQCGAEMRRVKKKFKRKQQQHPDVFHLKTKPCRKHVSAAEKKQKTLYTGQKLINQYRKRKDEHSLVLVFSFSARSCFSGATLSTE